MAPPFYSDLGKRAGDLFSKGYHFGLMKLDLKTKSESGVEFNSGLTSTQESGKVFGTLQSKYTMSDLGLTFIEKWNTENVLGTEITIAEKIAPGVKVTLEGSFAPHSGQKAAKLKSSFVNDMVAANTSIDLDMEGPVVDATAVLHYEGWLAGVLAQFDTQKTAFNKNHFAIGYQTDKFAVHTNVDNGSDFGGSVYQKVSDQIECGVNLKWSVASKDTLFAVAAKYNLDADASIYAKVTNTSLVGLGYTQKLREGIFLTLSTCIDGQNFNSGGHKFGIALELSPTSS